MTVPKKGKDRHRARKERQRARTEGMQLENLQESPALQKAFDASKANTLACSFCGKSQNEVKKLIAGQGRVYICNECIDICKEIIADDEQYAATQL